MRVIFLAFLLICQLGLAISSSAAEFDPNELVLQRFQVTKPVVVKKAAPANIALRNPSKPIIDDAQRNDAARTITPIKAPASPVEPLAKTVFRAHPIVEAPKSVKAARVKKTVHKVQKAAQKKQALNDIETASEGRKAITWFSTLSNAQRMTITFSQRPSTSFEQKDGELLVKFAAPAEYAIPAIPAAFSANFMAVEKVGESNLIIRVKHKAGAKPVVTYNERRVFIDIPSDSGAATVAAKEPAKETAAPTPEKPAEKPAEKTAAAAPSPLPVVKMDSANLPEALQAALSPATPTAVEPKYVSYDKNITVEKDGDLESYTFKFDEKTDSALFERFGNYWLVFYSKEAVGLPNISKSEMFSDVEIIPNNKAIVYKFSIKKQAYAEVKRPDAHSWKITFDPLVEHPVEYPLSLNKDGEEWYVNVPGVENSVEVKDDFTNEVLTIFPSQNAGEGFKDRVIYRDFVVEKSLQGIVLRKITEGSKVDFSRNQLRLTPSIMPQKLFADKANGGEQASALIDFIEINKLAKGLSGEDANEMMKKIDANLRGEALFAIKYYREAAVDLGSRVGFDNSFLASAAYFLSGRFDKTVSDLQRINIPAGKDKNEYFLWLIAAQQELIKQNPRAKVNVTIPDGFALPLNFKNYPVNVATALELPLIEAALANGKTDLAELISNNIKKTGIPQRDLDYARYLRGKIFAAQNLTDRAIELWTDLISKTDSREVRARAIYAKVTAQLDAGKIDAANALKELNVARVLWRGDAIEFDVLTKAAQLYIEQKQYSDALWAYKTAITTIPLHPRSDEITADMRKIYKLALQGNYKDLDKSFEALSIYNDFIELKPTGREGDYMTIELAERLVSFDLIPQAIKVLEGFDINGNDPEEKALINTRIAVLYYLNREPDNALARLDESDNIKMPKYIEWHRRSLYVKLLAQQGKYDEALAKINRLPPQKALMLKAEIYWYKQDWQNFLQTFDGMTAKTDEDTMKAAVAYAMLADDKATQSFRKQNFATMKKTKYAKSFDFITQSDALNAQDLTNSLRLDFAKQTIADYRNEMKLTDFYGKTSAASATDASVKKKDSVSKT